MRVRGGETVVLFDGSGREFAARVERVGRQEVELAIVSRQEADRELPLEIELGVALPKGDRQAWLVEKAVELGIAGLTPLKTQRGVAQPVEKAIARLRRNVIEASKQCGRNRLMQIHEPRSWEEFLRGAAAADSRSEMLRLLAQPGGQSINDVLAATRGGSHVGAAWLAIGPEGGFSDSEVQSAIESGWQVIDLGPRILRVETAAVLLAAVVSILAGRSPGAPTA
jgi:16S rRNA (uracil1498-N3)-methyltransferase